MTSGPTVEVLDVDIRVSDLSTANHSTAFDIDKDMTDASSKNVNFEIMDGEKIEEGSFSTGKIVPQPYSS